MPLIVSALDVKLARAHDEMLVRKQRLDLLAEIYRRSANLYDVTNFVAVGSNQILQLVYKVSEELLVREEHQLIEDTVGTDLIPLDPSRNRVSDWLDLFLYYPRLYLLISTSVDYGLSVGRLPHDNALPDLLRPKLGDVLKIELPWMVAGDQGESRDRKSEFWCPSSAALPLSVVLPTANDVDTSGTESELAEPQPDMREFQPQHQPAEPTNLHYSMDYDIRSASAHHSDEDLNMDFLNMPAWHPTAGTGPSTSAADTQPLFPPKDMGYTGEIENFGLPDLKQSLDLGLIDYINQATLNQPYMLNTGPYDVYGNREIDCNGRM